MTGFIRPRQTTDELSAKLLRLWAYFDNQLLRHGDSEDPEWIHELTKDELTFNGAVRVLSDHGLVEVDMSSQERVESRGYGIHGCVHSWVVTVLNQEPSWLWITCSRKGVC